MMGMFKMFVGQVSDFNPELGGKLAAFIPAEKEPPPEVGAPCPRWEKAMLAVKGIAQQVSKIDKDGIEVMVVGDEVEEFNGIKNASSLMKICDGVEPDGGLTLGAALSKALDEATERLYGDEGSHKEQAILVVLSRKPDDAEELVAAVQEAAAKVKQDSDLTITFVHVGNDADAEEYLSFIDDNLKVTSEETGEEIDIVDTLKDEDIQKAFAESQDPGFMASGGTGALIGAMAGMAAGVGGYYAYQKHCIAKRTRGFNGAWYVIGSNGQKTKLHLKITDDMDGNLKIKGYPDEEPEDFEDSDEEYEWEDGEEGEEGGEDELPPWGRSTAKAKYQDGTCWRYTADEEEVIPGTIEDESTVVWEDGTRWEENKEKVSMIKMGLAGVGGAMLGGAAGYLVQKKFFNKASNKTPADYIIILDRSAAMSEMDT